MKKLIFLFVIVIFPIQLFSDVAELDDGTVLVGKVLEDKGDTFLFRNSYGTFTIEKSSVKTIQKTTDYREDISLLAAKGDRISEEKIRQDYIAGLGNENLNQPPATAQADPWMFEARFMPWFLVTAGTYYDPVPLGFSLSADMIYFFNRPFNVYGITFTPGINVRNGYIHLQKDDRHLVGYLLNTGPVIFTSPFTSLPLRCEIGVYPGISFLHARDGSDSTFIATYSNNTSLGVTYNFKGIPVCVSISHVLILDRDKSMNCFGFSIGAAYTFQL